MKQNRKRKKMRVYRCKQEKNSKFQRADQLTQVELGEIFLVSKNTSSMW